MDASISLPNNDCEPGPRFSVIIPTCGRNESLARCLDRLAPGSQSLPPGDYEVIVSDDGAPDVNAERMMGERYPWARWIRGPAHGPAANRNCGAAHARGPWLVFTDDDCMPGTGWLAAFDAHLSRAPADRVLEGRTSDGGLARPGPFYTAPLNQHGGFLWSCNLAIIRRLYEELGGFDEGFPYPHMEDVDLRMRLEDRAISWQFVPEASVDHPPRPLGSAIKWARSHESSYYLARKRGVPVSRMGFSMSIFLRVWLRYYRQCRHFGDAIAISGRIAAEMALLLVYIPGWMMRYRGRAAASAAQSRSVRTRKSRNPSADAMGASSSGNGSSQSG